jgi:hypothetical protein
MPFCREEVPLERVLMCSCYLQFWIANLRRMKGTIPPVRGSAARSAAGLHARKINGSAHADTNGTRLIREACAQLACTSGRKLSAFRAAGGRRILSGMPPFDFEVSNIRTESETATHEPCMNGGKCFFRATSKRRDHIIFELVQQGKLLVKCAYRLWIGERVAAT